MTAIALPNGTPLVIDGAVERTLGWLAERLRAAGHEVRVVLAEDQDDVRATIAAGTMVCVGELGGTRRELTLVAELTGS